MVTRKPPRQLYIDGEWINAADGSLFELTDPATGQVVDSIPVATHGDVDAALGAAEHGFNEWRYTDAWTRCGLLRTTATLIRDRADWIGEVITEEQGKPISEARAEVLASADHFDWHADEAR